MLNTNEKNNGIESLDLSNASVDIITKLIHERKVSCEELVHHYFDNIEKQQSLNAFISTDKASAIQQAQYWDKYLLSGKPCPALMGILIAVKDNIHVAGFPNSAGTPALAQFRPQTSAPVIQKLIDQGAIIVGKANMHELAFGVTGYNTAMHIEGVVGTRNAVNPLHIAGGSSSGDVQAIFKLNILPELTLDPTGQLVPVLPLYEKAISEARPQLLELYQNTFKAHNLHALLFPTSPIVAPLANEEVYSIETFQTLMRNTDPGSNIGIPGLSLPIGMGTKSKLPVGLEIDGLAHQDSEILAIGITLEKIFKGLNQ